ncbi:MAG: PEGA domain-containing protein [Deltaproteobacteria bacterium]|nr:MAG: PEGA domain-containing protein [Deltaproteobacteria bacterium]
MYRPLQPGPLATVLEKALPADPAADVAAELRRADELIAEAIEHITNLREEQARELLKRAEARLIRLKPTRGVLDRLAEINFQLGRIYMRRSDSRSATDAFRVTMRLQPDRPPPDPRRYDPDVIEAWRAASLAQARTAVVTVTAPFDGARVFIDGVQVGVTPYRAQLEPGAHYFWAEMDNKQPAGMRATAIFEEPREVNLQIRRLPDDAIAARVKRSLLAGPLTEQAIATAVQQLYELLLVKYVIVLADRDPTGIGAAVFDARGARVTEWVPVTERDAAALVRALPGRVDLSAPAVAGDAGPPAPPADAGPPERPWWRNPMSYAAVGGGALIVVVGVLILTASEDAPAPHPDLTCCIAGDGFQ